MPWDPEGGGDPSGPSSWRAGAAEHGSPGRADDEPGPGAEPDASGLVLEPVYPNPVTTAAMVEFGVDVEQQVRLVIHDTLGRTVGGLAGGMYEAGVRGRVCFHRERLGAGVYILRLEGERVVAFRTLVVVPG